MSHNQERSSEFGKGRIDGNMTVPLNILAPDREAFEDPEVLTSRICYLERIDVVDLMFELVKWTTGDLQKLLKMGIKSEIHQAARDILGGRNVGTPG